MPAKGTKKKKPTVHGKSRVLNFRAEEDTAARILQAGDGSVSSGMRAVIAQGLDALERKEAGLGPGGKLKVEMSGEERAAWDKQRRFAMESQKRAEADRKRRERLTASILGALRGKGPVLFSELLKRAGGNGMMAEMADAIRLLERRGAIVSQGGAGEARSSRYLVLVDEAAQSASPTVQAGAEAVREKYRNEWRVRTRDVREELGSAHLAAEVLAYLRALGELERDSNGVYAWILRRGHQLPEGS